MPYSLRLHLTAADVEAIALSGSRHGWSSVLGNLAEGDNCLSVGDLWSIYYAVKSDVKAGRSRFPMLAPGSLRDKIEALLDQMV